MHRHLDGAPQVLLGDVEAVVADLPLLQGVLMLGGLTEDRRDSNGGNKQPNWKTGRSC